MNSHQTHQQLSIRSGGFGLHSICVNWMFWGLEQTLQHETQKLLGAGMIPVDFHICLCLSAQAPTRNLILKLFDDEGKQEQESMQFLQYNEYIW